MFSIFEVVIIINPSILYDSAAFTCSLNGKNVKGSRLLVQPAPVFPLAVLKALWSQPEERQRVKAVICNLSRNLDGPISKSDLVSEYYGKEF